MLIKLPVLLSLSLLAASAVLADETFSLKAGYASVEADGKFAGEDGGTGTRIDFEGDLDFDDSDNAIIEGALQLGRFRFSAGYVPLEFSGNGTLTNDVTFDGQTFSSGSTVQSDVEIEVFDLAAAFHVIDIDDGPTRLQLGPELSIKLSDVSMSVRDTSSGQRESVNATVPIPTIGARGRLTIGDYLGVVGRVGYLEVDENSFLDTDVQVEYSPLPLVGFFAGYRYVDVDLDESDAVLQATFSGPYAGVLMRF